jgi:hypothetical protein
MNMRLIEANRKPAFEVRFIDWVGGSTEEVRCVSPPCALQAWLCLHGAQGARARIRAPLRAVRRPRRASPSHGIITPYFQGAVAVLRSIPYLIVSYFIVSYRT